MQTKQGYKWTLKDIKHSLNTFEDKSFKTSYHSKGSLVVFIFFFQRFTIFFELKDT